MRILLLSAYDAPSHRYWREGLARYLVEFEFTQLVLPPRYFSWRIRGNSLSWLNKTELTQQYDLIVATSMVDLATLRGLFPRLAATPCIYYFHENQFAYPVTGDSHKSLEPQMVSVYGALAADNLVFNSAFNRLTFLAGVEDLLKGFPDAVPSGVVETLREKSQVLAVPIARDKNNSVKPMAPFSQENPLIVVWNHRWEYDKGPERLLALIQQLPGDLPLLFHVVGQQFRQTPKEFADIKILLEERGWLGEWGFIDNKNDYFAILAKSHCVLSTSCHDFQGIAVLEAVAAGCVPLVPRRLAYAEWFADEYSYASHPDICQEAKGAVAMINAYCAGKAVVIPSIEFLSWENLIPCYRQLFLATAKL